MEVLRLVPRAGLWLYSPVYIEAVPNRHSPPAILLRESYREGGKVCKRRLCNLSDWASAHIEGLGGVLKGGTVIPPGSPRGASIRMPMASYAGQIACYVHGSSPGLD